MEQKNIEVFVAGPEHEVYVDTILQTIADAAKVRGTGIAKRTHRNQVKNASEPSLDVVSRYQINQICIVETRSDVLAYKN